MRLGIKQACWTRETKMHFAWTREVANSSWASYCQILLGFLESFVFRIITSGPITLVFVVLFIIVQFSIFSNDSILFMALAFADCSMIVLFCLIPLDFFFVPPWSAEPQLCQVNPQQDTTTHSYQLTPFFCPTKAKSHHLFPAYPHTLPLQQQHLHSDGWNAGMLDILNADSLECWNTRIAECLHGGMLECQKIGT